MPTSKEKVRSKAIEILKSRPNGIRYTELVNAIHDAIPEIPINTIQGSMWDLDARMPDEVYKPARGLWRHVSFKGTDLLEKAAIKIAYKVPSKAEKIKEDDFYESFASWLVNELKECNK